MGKDLNVSYLLDIYGGLLTEKQADLVDYYYNDDLSLAEIAENEGVSRQGVSDTIKRAVLQLKEYEEKLGIRASSLKISEIKSKVFSLSEAMDGIETDGNLRKLLDEILSDISSI